ncbi:MAG: hypothetical protein KatS3mg002_0960 [Candidatus Woesearchaeota archaeon]|nr:MAG: hypothetical protein KatS3mg002_0960 [Candidatus Woesearchaeota archaeon]
MNQKRPLLADSSLFSFDMYDPLISQKITDPRTGKNYTYKERNSKILLCRPEMRTSGEVYLKTYDAATREPLKDVFITFGCGNYATCQMGKTKHDSILNVESFNDKMPICMNGYLKLTKPGYKEKILRITTSSQKINLGSVYLEPLVRKNVSIKIYPLTRRNINVAGNILSIDLVMPNQSYYPNPNDTITISLSRIQQGLDEPMEKNIIISQDSNITEIELIPGMYTIKGSLLSADGFIIPKGCKEVCDGGFLGTGIGSDCKKFPDENIVIKPALIGGIEIDEKYPFIIKRSDLMNNNTLEIYLIKIPPPPCIDQMQEMSSIRPIALRYRDRLTPRFIN